MLTSILQPSAYCHDWTLLVYMEVGDTLGEAALKSLNEMMQTGSGERVTIKVQLHTIDNQAWRYCVEKNCLILEQTIGLAHNPEKDLTDALFWAFADCSSTYTMVVLYGHGFGILEPPLNAGRNTWNHDSGPLLFELLDDHHLNSSPFGHRAILLQKDRSNFLSNEQLARALEKLHALLGKKITIVGFDACMMAMIEVAYEIEPHVLYMVGSQEYEHKEGWDYGFLKTMIEGKDPIACMQALVVTYDHYYKHHVPNSCYMQSALDLTTMQPLANAIERIVTIIKSCQVLQEKTFLAQLYGTLLHKTRFFHVRVYRDLYSFFDSLKQALLELDTLDTPKEVLMFELDQAMNAIKRMVIAHCIGAKAQPAWGLSIYFPSKVIDQSYSKTKFGQETGWLGFLQWLQNFTNVAIEPAELLI